MTSLWTPRSRVGDANPDGVLPPVPTLAEAESALDAYGENGDRISVYNSNTGAFVCTLQRVSSGVFFCRYVNFAEAAADTFTIGSGGTEDIVLAAGASASVVNGEGLKVTGSNTFVTLAFMGNVDPAMWGGFATFTNLAADNATAVGDRYFAGCLLNNGVMVGGGVYADGTNWRGVGYSGAAAGPTATGTSTFSSLPATAYAAWKHTGRGSASTQAYAIGFCTDAADSISSGLVSGALVSNHDAAANTAAVVGCDITTTNLTAAVRDFAFAGRAS